MLKKALLYFNTLKYLKWIQCYYRLLYFFYKPRLSTKIKKSNLKENTNIKKINFLKNDKIFINNETATFLNRSYSIASNNCWNNKDCEKLWLYNLHYFDALNAEDHSQQMAAYRLLERWVDENKPFFGIAWDSFPISLRIVNIIKYALCGNFISEKIKKSLYLQARMLNKKCEYHLLGNHLFENFKSLCFVGLFFDTKESTHWFNKGFKGLKKEISKQILNDGGHFELSPMYHSLILEGLLDLQTLFQFYEKEFIWKETVQKMLRWLVVMSRSKTEISYFNDAANQIAKSPEVLCQYATKLGCDPFYEKNNVAHLRESGFIAIKNNFFKIICDVGNIGPDYLPGHAHADSLSFELYIDETPVFVNLGTSCYGLSNRRLFERSTAAHNTVVMNCVNSSEVWSGFRVGKRACVCDFRLTKHQDNMIVMASHNGYATFKNNLIHERRWDISEKNIQITDRFNHSVDNTFAYFHLHPHCRIISNFDKKITIQVNKSHQIEFESENESFIIENDYANTFGDLQKTQSIKVKLESGSCISQVFVGTSDDFI